MNMNRRLPFRILSVFFVFAVILVLPLTATVMKDLTKMIDGIDDASPMTTAQKIEYLKYKEKMLDDIVIISFYIFILAFIISLIFSRRLLSPINDLRDAMIGLSEGRNGLRLDYLEEDEIGFAVKAFNRTSRDIEIIRRANDRHGKMIELFPMPVALIDDDHIIREVTPSFTKAFGYSSVELEGYGLFEFLEEESAKKARRKLVEAHAGGTIAFTVKVISKSDGLVPVRLELARLARGDETDGMVAFLKDLRSEEALETALRLERENAEAIIDSTEDLVIIVDRDFVIRSANLAMRVKNGRDVIGEQCHMTVYGREERCYLKGHVCYAREVFESGNPFRSVMDKKEDDGSKHFYDVMASPLKDSAGEVRQVVLSMRDITERVRFEDEIDRKNHELTSLNEISWVLSRSLRSEGVYDEVVDKLCEIFGMDGGGIYFQDEMGRTLKCDSYKGLSPDFMTGIRVLKLEQDIPGSVASTLMPFFSHDIAADRRAEGSAFRHTGIRSFACVPVRGKEKLIGVFFVFGFSERTFSDEDEATLGAISEMMGISFDNSRLYGRMKSLYEQDRQRRSDEQKDLLNLTSLLASSPDMDAVLGPSLELVKRSCWADLACLVLLDEDRGLIVRATSDPLFASGELICSQGSNSLESVSLERKEPVVISGLPSARNINVDERLCRYFTGAAVPIHVGNRALGVLSLYYTGEIVPSDDEVHFLRTIGSVFGVALERTRLFESVAIQRSMAETVLESIGDGVVTLSPAGVVISMNKAAGQILGVRHEKTVGFQVEDILSSDGENFEFRVKFMEGLTQAAVGKHVSQQATVRRPDGSLVPVAFSCSPAHAGADSMVGAVYVLRDLSEIRELDKMKTDFVRSVSHELRTPLTAIVGMTEMVLEEEVDSDRAREYLETVLEESQRLAGMVSDVLDISRIESGDMEFDESDVDFVTIAESVSSSMKAEVDEHRATLDVSVKPGAQMRGDAEKLKLMLGHLVENSLKYSDKGVNVSVVVEADEDNIDITVSDDGWGISEKDLPRVGERFFRAVTSVARKGAGLGLAICRQIASMHKGSLKIESKKGEGTRVIVTLPRGRS